MNFDQLKDNWQRSGVASIFPPEQDGWAGDYVRSFTYLVEKA